MLKVYINITDTMNLENITNPNKMFYISLFAVTIYRVSFKVKEKCIYYYVLYYYLVS